MLVYFCRQDLKKYHFFYWFASPCLVAPESVSLSSPPLTLNQRFSVQQVGTVVACVHPSLLALVYSLMLHACGEVFPFYLSKSLTCLFPFISLFLFLLFRIFICCGWSINVVQIICLCEHGCACGGAEPIFPEKLTLFQNAESNGKIPLHVTHELAVA